MSTALVQAGAPERVVVLRFSSVGDIVLTSPAIAALHTAWPQTEIVYAVREGFDGLVRHSPHVHDVIVIGRDEGVVSFARRLRALGFDALLDLHGSLRCRALRPLLPRTRRAIWTKRRWQDGLPVRLGLKRWRGGMWLADRFHLAVEELVGRKLERGRLSYWLGPDDQDRARERLEAARVCTSEPMVGLSPGAGWPTKRWPVERFGGLARELVASGRQVVVSGSPDEYPLCQQIVREAPGAVFVEAKLPIWAGMISLFDAFVANDSGPMHIARGLGIPTLAFFGSTDPEQFDFSGHAVLFGDVPCAPCHFYGRPFCPRLHFRCMKELELDAAQEAVHGLLSAPGVRVVHG